MKLPVSICFFLNLTMAYAQPSVSFHTIANNLSSPVDIVNAGDGTGRLFIVEQTGTIRIWNGSMLLPVPFLDISSRTLAAGEQGLLSLAFHPDYKNNGFFFVYYNNRKGEITIARFKTSSASPDIGDPASEAILMSIPKPFANHNGGKLGFGDDGYLYFGTGDGGSGGDPFHNAQNGKSYLGKMLRLQVTTDNNHPYYTIPTGNPYKNSADFFPEIIATGLRNPWRWCFDKKTGDMWIADVGQNSLEEVNFRPKDSILNINYGWNCFEGLAPYNTLCSAAANNVFPIFQYPHNSMGGFSITGGQVYRGADYPFLQGYYLFADFVSGNTWIISPKPLQKGWSVFALPEKTRQISGFGESESGEMYAVTLQGLLLRVMAVSPTAFSVLSGFSVKNKGVIHELVWHIDNQQKDDIYIIERSIGSGSSFALLGQITAGNASSQDFTFTAAVTSNTDHYYRVRVFPAPAGNYYSTTLRVTADTVTRIRIRLANEMVQVFATEDIASIEMIDMAGRRLITKTPPSNTRVDYIRVNALPKGVFICKVKTVAGNSLTNKLIH
jgi:glucose/arabinose dehydrogenase